MLNEINTFNKPVDLDNIQINDDMAIDVGNQDAIISEINDNINHNVHVILSTIFKSGETITIGGTQYTILFYAVSEQSLPKIVGKYANKIMTDQQREDNFNRLPLKEKMEIIDNNKTIGEETADILTTKGGRGGSNINGGSVANPYQENIPILDGVNNFFEQLTGLTSFELKDHKIDPFLMKATKCQVGIDLKVALGKVSPQQLPCLVKTEKVKYSIMKLFSAPPYMDLTNNIDENLEGQHIETDATTYRDRHDNIYRDGHDNIYRDGHDNIYRDGHNTNIF
jgi:hypothetical protein